MKRTILATTILGLSFTANAELQGCTATDNADNATSFYFANGVGTSDFDALITSRDFQNAYESELLTLHDNASYKWSASYNYTQGQFTDVVQVLQQKFNEDGASEVGGFLIYNAIRTGIDNDTIRSIIGALFDPSHVGLFTDEYLDSVAEIMTQASVDALSDLGTVSAEQVTTYEADLVSGKRVLILAHSQGNLFTNSAIEEITERQPQRADSIAYFGVASPASYTAANASYVTADDDRVINLLRTTENVLPANLDNDPGVLGDNRSWTNHYMIQDYFEASLASRPVIDDGVLAIATNTPFPVQIAGEGAIRASLSWGIQPDVDLHVFEPDGTQVYYVNKVGNDGTLDVDDQNGQGPENYVVACNDVNEGTYTVGVNYYRGDAPEKAIVTLFLGDGRVVGPRETLLEFERGRGGNDTPETMYTITVTDDGTGKAIYTIE